MPRAETSRAIKPRRLLFECLESRQVLTVLLAADDFALDHMHSAEARGGPSGPAIDLATVALHEIGHALGLEHSTSPLCGTSAATQPVMCPYYLGPSFSLKAEDIAKITALYPDILGSTTDIVADATDDRWDNPNITYSYMPDGSKIDQGGKGGSNLLAKMAAKIGTNWQAVFAAALSQWAEATQLVDTHHVLQFTKVDDSGAPFNATGASQGDSRFGDVRFGGHKFDGVGGTLAHTYYPPPNGATAAGDSHYAAEENWQNLSNVLLSPGPTSGSGLASGSTAAGGASAAARSARLQGLDNQMLLDNAAVRAIFGGPDSTLGQASNPSEWPIPLVDALPGNLIQQAMPSQPNLSSATEPPLATRLAQTTKAEDEDLYSLLTGEAVDSTRSQFIDLQPN